MHSHKKQPLIGVIDIGSNSVRLVVYDRLSRVPRPLFNEKITCQLGKGLEDSGRLYKAGKKRAIEAIGRFIYLTNEMGVTAHYAIATAAMREAKDGAEFVAIIKDKYGLEINVISGEREAELAAKGIFASIYQPHGVAGDLGGGSLELVHLHDNKAHDRISLPIGALRLISRAGHDIDKMRTEIRSELEHLTWLKDIGDNFYAIGGGFRSIASVHMAITGYPLPILHDYSLDTDILRPFFTYLLSLPQEQWSGIKGLSSRRVHSFLPSILLLEEIIRITDCKKVIFSSCGIREGLLYDKLETQEQHKNGLESSLQNILHKERVDTDYDNALYTWIEQSCPILTNGEYDKRLLQAVCMMGDISLHSHPEFRASWAFEHIIQSNIWGLSHSPRVILALALYHRYRRKWKLDDSMLMLISKRDRCWAHLVGQLANFAFELSGGVPSLLVNIELQFSRNSQPKISGKAETLAMLPETLEKRLDGLGDIYNDFSNSNK